MARARQDPKGWMVAREPVVVVVGARAPVYQTSMVRDRRTDQMVEVQLTEFEPVDPGAEGRSYAFKQYEKVHSTHEAVKELPGAFMPLEEFEDAELGSVVS